MTTAQTQQPAAVRREYKEDIAAWRYYGESKESITGVAQGHIDAAKLKVSLTVASKCKEGWQVFFDCPPSPLSD